jgi:hypothetical protein
MKIFSNRKTIWTVIGVLVSVVIITAGILILVIGGRQATTPGAQSPASSSARSPAAEATTFKVYFHRGEADDPGVVPVERTVPATEKVATAALGELLAGPTEAELKASYWSSFNSATAGMLRSVRVANEVARVDFRDFSQIIPNASASFGSAALMAELDTTLKQFPTVKSTVYSFDGDITAFYSWLRLAPPIGPPGDAAPAIAAARQFLTKVVGMNQPMEGPLRWIGNGLAEVTFYARPPSGQPLPGLATIVTVQRGAGHWSVIGTNASRILVDSPTRGQMISSPVSVSGRAHAFEGTVTVRVLEDRKGTPTELGSGFVTGGGDQLGPFSGQITFNQPDGGSGWIIFTELSAVNGEVNLATSVQVSYPGRAAPPAVNEVRSTLPVQDDWLQLPAGAGTVTFTVQTSATDQLEFHLTPTGTETAPLAKLLGTGTKAGDEFTFTWNYPDEPLLAHLELVAIGPGGRTELTPFNVYHE